MNLLLINYDYPPLGAGASFAARYLAENFVKLGHSVTVITSAYKQWRGVTIENEVEVVRITAIRRKRDRSNIFEMASFVLSAILKGRKIVKKNNIEMAIIFYTLPLGPIGLFLKIPFVISLRGGDVPFHMPEMNTFHRVLAPLRRLVLKRATVIVANSESFAALSRRTDDYPISVVTNGVDSNFYRPLKKTERKSHEKFQLIFVGRFREEKNVMSLPNILGQLVKQHGTHFHLHLVGNGSGRVPLYNKSAFGV